MAVAVIRRATPRAIREKSMTWPAFLVLLSVFLSPCAADAADPCGADALGTARVMPVGTQGGLQVGLKSYPRTLPLQDHEVILTFDDGPAPGKLRKSSTRSPRNACGRRSSPLGGWSSKTPTWFVARPKKAIRSRITPTAIRSRPCAA